MEAGNRCYDDRVPEEVNRRVIDHCSTVLMPYTRRSMENLVREGIERERIFVTGNPIFEVLEAHRDEIAGTDVMARLGVERGRYFLVTLHRAENVDEPSKLTGLLRALTLAADEFRSRCWSACIRGRRRECVRPVSTSTWDAAAPRAVAVFRFRASRAGRPCGAVR